MSRRLDAVLVAREDYQALAETARLPRSPAKARRYSRVWPRHWTASARSTRRREEAGIPNGWDDCTHWQSADRATLERINRFVDGVPRDPFGGIASSCSVATRVPAHLRGHVAQRALGWALKPPPLMHHRIRGGGTGHCFMEESVDSVAEC